VTFWSATRLVAARELSQRGRDRSFYVSTAVTLLIVLAVVALPQLLGANDRTSYTVAFTGPQAEQVAAAARVQARAADADLRTRPAGDQAEQLREGTLDAVVGDGQVSFAAKTDRDLLLILQVAWSQVGGEGALAEAGMDPTAVARALDVPPLQVRSLDPPDEAAETREAVAFFGTFLLYFQLVGYGFWVALGVVEEKSSRVVEVLLATVPSRALLAGKILGIGLLGLGQLLFVAGVGLGVAAAVGTVELDASLLPVVGLVLGFFVLGYAFYASFFAAAAARVTQQEDLQNVTTPATLVLVASFLASFYVANEPDAPVSRVLSLLPPFSALVNPARVAAGEASAWQVVLAVVLMLAATAALVVVAARLYEGAVLRMGGKVSVRDAWRGARATRPR